MTGIPPVVPLTLRTEATRVQNQLKVLITNYRVIFVYNKDYPARKYSAALCNEWYWIM